MGTPANANRETYGLGRKAALVLGFGMLVLFGMMQSSVLSRNLGSSGSSKVHKQMPFAKFHLASNETWSLTLGEDEPAVFYPPALEVRETYEMKDNLKWHDGKPAAEKHPEALEWFRFSNVLADPKNRLKKTSRKRLLMAQYSNHEEFAEIFKMTKLVNIAYAERWGHDIVFLNAQELPTTEANMATLVQLAWEEREKYDQLLLLDADAMMNNFREDVTTLFPGMEMMVAKRVVGRDDPRTWNVFGTVSLWNLRHLLVPRVQRTWSSRFEEEDPLITLAEQLKPYGESEVFTVTRQIGHFDSSIIKTIQYATKTHGVRKVAPQERIDRWSTEVKRTCKRWKLDCIEASPEQRRASQLPNIPTDCIERREPTWEWREQRTGEPKTQKRLLIAQFVSYGNYTKLFEMTGPINKLYAKKWNVDYVSVQGTTLTIDQDGGCEPPPQRAMFDKLKLLQMALHKRGSYDQLLLLDADAMIYDFDVDITTLAEDDDLLVAQRGAEKSSRTHTWNINNGIVLWNLHHPLVQAVSDEWDALSRSAVKEGDAHGDQHYLQAALREGNRQQFVRGLNQEFRYRRGTVVKHFTRRHANNEWNNTRVDEREMDIELVVKEICEKHPTDCQNLEESVYRR